MSNPASIRTKTINPIKKIKDSMLEFTEFY